MSEKIKPLLCEGRIEGRVVNEMLVDTGAVRTIVNSRWVPGSARLKKYIRFVPFSGPPRDLPLVDVTVDVGGQQVKLEVGVQEDLQYDALLGRDIPFLWNLGDHLRDQQYVGAVQTRAQTKCKQSEHEAEQLTDQQSEAEITPWMQQSHDEAEIVNSNGEIQQDDEKYQQMVTSADVTDNPLPDFDDELFTPPKASRVKLSRSQKRAERQQHSSIVTGPDLQNQGTDKLCRAQQEDPTLTDICKQMREGS